MSEKVSIRREGTVREFRKFLASNTGGASYVEQVVLVATVAVGVCAAMIPLGVKLLDYHTLIETVLGWPIP